MDTHGNPVERAQAGSGLSTLALAEASGIPRSTLKRKIIDPRTFTLGELGSIARACNVDPDELAADIFKAA